MIDYKLTLLKDLPNVPAGYSYSVSGDRFIPIVPYGYNDYKVTPDEEEARTFMVNHRNNPDWVKMEVDYHFAIQEARCSNCGKPLFSHLFDEDYYKAEVGLECANCGMKVYTHTIQKRTDWRD